MASSEQLDSAWQTRGQDHQDRLDDRLAPRTGLVTCPDACKLDSFTMLDSLQDLHRTFQGMGFADPCQTRSAANLQSAESRLRSPPAHALEIRQKNAALARKAKASLSKMQPQQGSMSGPQENQGSNVGNQAKLRLPMGSESCMQYTLDLQRMVHRAVFSGTLHCSGASARVLRSLQALIATSCN